MKPNQFEVKMKAAAQEVAQAKDALQQIALAVQAAAMRNTPVKTGTLRRSITTRVEGNAAYVGTSVVYAPFVEYGTRHMPARPYLSTGLDDAQQQIEEIAERFGVKVLDKVAGGGR